MNYFDMHHYQDTKPKYLEDEYEENYFGLNDPYMRESFGWEENNLDYSEHEFIISQENSQSSHLDSMSETTDDDMYDKMETMTKIYLQPSDLPSGVHNAVKRFKIEYLYEKYDEMWNRYTDENNNLITTLNNKMNSYYSPEEIRAKALFVESVFERVKIRLNESFLRDKDNILDEVIDGSVDKKSTKILKNWFDAHYQNPFPNDDEKKALAFMCDLEVKQVSTWFGNHRGRCKRKLLDSPRSIHDTPMWIYSSK